MKDEIEKIKTDYDLKIEGCDILIKHMGESIKRYRSEANKWLIDSIRRDRAIEQAKRQAYVQAKYDFDSLLDYV